MNTADICEKIKENITKVIIGKEDVIDKVLICLICGGHVLLEDMPGTGKTTLAKALAASVGGDFKRIQFTPDLLPSELTGMKYFNQKEGEFVFNKGMVFTNILLADEINRATPRTQSSLLECMEEHQVSDHGVTYKLENPFMVIATQNPVETQGTFPLPEAQLDRFFMKLSMGYPTPESEADMLLSHSVSNPLDSLKKVVSADEINSVKEKAACIYTDRDIVSYIINIAAATRNDNDIKLGVSPRGSLALLNASKGHAAIKGREYVVPDDVKAVAGDVLSHRIILKRLTPNMTVSSRDIIGKILSQVPVPVEQG
ncbi:MAG: MoxR family ATPase [Ruminococcus sp.]|nr:MoxR family ATPase [Ruminococcus sp.]